MIFQLAIILSFLALGEITVALTAIPIPSSIVGMILLTIALQTKLVSLKRVERVSEILVSNMGLFFVPAGIGLIDWLGLLGQQCVPIVVALILSSIIIIGVTGHSYQIMRRSLKRDLSRRFGKIVKQ